ncbi:uncharacterized protein LOC116214889 [Punica granatum]|uniref:Uncharacterized protein LOC116214889 n=2 Tax=Punica granatum TaxID=22663 RepID=A0A6P8E8A0_PUNGR|nr:uncharacterized protein LOC116214889 [Punica granatum]
MLTIVHFKMKREGRQHGMVRTSRVLPPPYNPREGSRLINRLDSPPTAGLFAKVSSKPTNHSKFTSKCCKARCTECHMGPIQKSKDKTKGAQKLKSNDVVSSHRLITWRVVDGRHGSNFAGLSATGLLDHLAYESTDNDQSYDHEYDASDDDDDVPETSTSKLDGGEDRGFRIDGDDYDENLSFFDVGLVLNQVEEDEEGWCLVGENIIG